MVDDETIRTVEIAAARAWPASDAVGVGGWLARRTPAVDRARSNAALPPPGRPGRSADLDAAIDGVEWWYRACGATPQIQVSPVEWHGALDRRLEERGWTVAHGAGVFVAPVADVLAAGPQATGILAQDTPTPRWLAAWGACEERSPASCAAHGEAILQHVVPRGAFASLHDPGTGEPVAAGLAVRDAGLAGIFCMATHPAHRRRGQAGRLLRALAAGAAEHGVHTLYLQMDTRNENAAGLYAAHGFRRSHGYHFRLAPAGA